MFVFLEKIGVHLQANGRKVTFSGRKHELKGRKLTFSGRKHDLNGQKPPASGRKQKNASPQGRNVNQSIKSTRVMGQLNAIHA